MRAAGTITWLGVLSWLCFVNVRVFCILCILRSGVGHDAPRHVFCIYETTERVYDNVEESEELDKVELSEGLSGSVKLPGLKLDSGYVTEDILKRFGRGIRQAVVSVVRLSRKWCEHGLEGVETHHLQIA